MEDQMQHMRVFFKAHDIMKRIPSGKALEIVTMLIANYIMLTERQKKEPWADKTAIEGIELIFSTHGIDIKKYID